MRYRELEGLRCSPYLYAVNSLEVVVKDVYQNYVNTFAYLAVSLRGMYLL